MLKVMIVDKNSGLRETIQSFLVRYNYQAFLANDCHEGKEILNSTNINVILVDVDSCSENILNDLDNLKRTLPGIVVVLTGSGDNPSVAIEALKRGANDYFVKPLDLNRILILLEKLEIPPETPDEDYLIEVKMEKVLNLDEIKGGNAAFGKLIELSGSFAASNSPILITGPTGSGKGVLARAIHNESPRKQHPFIDINCSAIPDHLFESEIFGYEAGAFTDAYKTQKGMIELASKGTFHCDEIGDMSLGMQARMLKVIEEKKFYRLGGHREIIVDARIIASTNHDLKKMIREGKFREDLYYRLAVAVIELPMLKDRPEDIIPLAEKFIREYCERNNIKLLKLSEKAREALSKYDWPGNIRELRNTVESMLIPLSEGEISLGDLPDKISGIKPLQIKSTQQFTQAIPLVVFERKYILEVLKMVDGNRDKAAQILGISRSTLFEKLKKYGLKHKD